MILLFLCLLNLIHGLRLHAGESHNKSNLHIIVKLQEGLNGTGLRFVDCNPNCSSGTVFFDAPNVMDTPLVKWKHLQNMGMVYDIQYTVPQNKQTQHIDMIIRPSGCTSSSCEVSEESYPECRPGHILEREVCHVCQAGKYQEEILCKDCVNGKTSRPGVQSCTDINTVFT